MHQEFFSTSNRIELLFFPGLIKANSALSESTLYSGVEYIVAGR